MANPTKVAKHLARLSNVSVDAVISKAQAIMAGKYPLIGYNTKTGISIMNSLQTCSPDLSCSTVCYAASGFFVMNTHLVKTLATDYLFRTVDPHTLAERIYTEALKFRPLITYNGRMMIRFNGSGDLTVDTCRIIVDLLDNHSDVSVYLYTRKPNMLRFLPVRLADRLAVNISLSSDPTHQRRMQFLPKDWAPFVYKTWLETDSAPIPEDIDVVFPERHNADAYAFDSRDCPADRYEADENACMKCLRCVIPKAALVA